ncbi:hypothetical protein M8J76_001385 [Diaphorina citri]|nr:hypothetical protein M8J75_000059 [Diaphorina citri]KAI5736244.1 hypothetical protein M8J76_001385 [Diaphorina citri]KAI5742114.1 hypothetical protein M8J77_003424 [Diaphorina citri]
MLRTSILSRNLLKSVFRPQNYSTATVTEAVVKEVPNNTDVKTTRVGKWIQYWKNVYRDYKTVFMDIGTQMKENPGKSSLKILGLSSLGYCTWANPDADNYFTQVLENHLRLVMVPNSIRNASSEKYIHTLETYHNLNLLRHQTFGIFSIVFKEDFSDHLEVYKKQCDYLHPSYLAYLKERIVDVGFLNHWYFMAKAMENYDVNPEEWKSTESELGS